MTNQILEKQSNPFVRFAPLFILFLIFTIIGFGMWGYFLIPGEGKNDPLSVLYDTLLMFKMESYEAGAINWQLILARYLAALIVGYGVYVLAVNHIQKWILRLKIQLFYRNHTIIAGLGLKGYLLAKDLKANNEKVVVIEHNPESIFIQKTSKDGIIVFISDGQNKWCWLNAGLLKAKKFVLVMDSDDKNIETATVISQLCNKRKGDNPLIGYIHIDNMHNFNLLKDHLDIQYGNTKIDFNVFNTNQLAAQRIWDIYPPHSKDSKEPLGSEISMLISGYNETVEAFLIENMILSQYRDLINIHVILIVKNAQSIGDSLKRKFPFMNEYLNIDIFEQPDEYFYNESLADDPEKRLISDEDFKKLHRVYVFGDDDSEVFLRAMKIRQCFYNRRYSGGIVPETLDFDSVMKYPELVVVLPEKTNIVELLNYQPGQTFDNRNQQLNENQNTLSVVNDITDNFNLVFFRIYSDTFNKSILFDQSELNTVLAKISNYLYFINYDLRDVLSTQLAENQIPQKEESLDSLIKELEKTLFNIQLPDLKNVNEKDTVIFKNIEGALFAVMRSKLTLPESFSFDDLGINKRWQLLTDRLEDSNIYAARHIQVKLLYPYKNNEDYSLLAPMEHKRWMAEKLTFQFRYGLYPLDKKLKKIIKEQLKLNALIVPYEDLPISERKKDLDLYRILDLMQRVTSIFKRT